MAPEDPQKAQARTAYRKIQAHIDGAKTPEALREIWDPVLDQWNTVFAQEVEQIDAVAPDSLNLLRERLGKRLEAVTAVDPFGLSRVSDETPASDQADPPVPDPIPPPAEPASNPSVEGTPVLYPERAARKVPRTGSAAQKEET